MDEQAFGRTAMQLVDAVREIIEAEIARATDCAEQLGRVLDLMAELHPDPDRPGQVEYPACRHLSRALELGEAGPAAAVARALRELAPSLAWAQNPRYNPDNMGADFMANYAWTGLGLTGSDRMSFGVLLLGPGVTYPPTSYESEGVFLVIGGTPEWKSGDGPWLQVQPGSIICRPYGGSEGKRPGKEPMLALYAWMYR
jgi:hypothetical protein